MFRETKKRKKKMCKRKPVNNYPLTVTWDTDSDLLYHLECEKCGKLFWISNPWEKPLLCKVCQEKGGEA